jgi:hypothetical protein
MYVEILGLVDSAMSVTGLSSAAGLMFLICFLSRAVVGAKSVAVYCVGILAAQSLWVGALDVEN